ncbi:aminodeoxychorismate/anthranilate synthase component II [Aliidiomarina haloalkalitolerans]|uniref:anthranilate synthase n=1 Tax=Aliidiomarina haloalkalitolerans TaxID=859059 RepID=A0A432VXM0_9GAMM|nr:aminodeoxychorismate/anthranilate synthase component II [Aliidiomarina haloalkalitolerans]MCL4409283.1 aminodeoxychorismate/anthranilate synthase component II [Gammaproteobacteria bacterium]RUO21396.1 anthranilate synthase component II [Aliidiomarina haloalkalitolerans]
MTGHIIFIDNVDSFTYNLVDEFKQLGYSLDIYRNTVSAATVIQRLETCAAQGPVILCLSPGPGHPSQAGCMPEVIRYAQGKYPMLGICLGFQALVELYGGVVDRCHETMHGKTSLMDCQPHPIFTNLPQPLPVARYHSLQAIRVPSSLEVIASVQQIPMAIAANTDRVLGFQFHPESIMTTAGTQLLKQSIEFLAQPVSSELASANPSATKGAAHA